MNVYKGRALIKRGRTCVTNRIHLSQFLIKQALLQSKGKDFSFHLEYIIHCVNPIIHLGFDHFFVMDFLQAAVRI